MENLMSTTSKHWVRVYPDYRENGDGIIVIPSSLNSCQSQSTIQTVQSGHQIARTYHTGLTLKSIYAQLHNNNKTITKQFALMEFNHYEKKEYILDHKGELTFTNFEDILFSNIPVTVNEKDKSWVENYFAQFSIHDDLIIQLEFKTNEGKMTISRKEFQKEVDNKLVPYFDEKIPSVYRSLNAESIQNFEHVVFERNKKTYLKLHHYNQLGLKVYTIINPEENKVVPAVVVEDMKGNVLEVHCYYKGEYISKDIMNALKPNILQEDFKAKNYFNVREIEFLDMTII
jgi:hypothetical protein